MSDDPELKKIKDKFSKEIESKEKPSGLKNKVLTTVEMVQPEVAPVIELSKEQEEKNNQKDIDEIHKKEEKELEKIDKDSEEKDSDKSDGDSEEKDSGKTQNKTDMSSGGSYDPMKLFDKLKDKTSNHQTTLVFFIFVLIHVYDLLNNFDRGAGNAYPMLLLYTLATLFVVLVIFHSGLSSDTWLFVGLSLAQFSIPYLAYMINSTNFTLFVALLPIWPIYLLFNPGDSRFLQVFSKVYFILLLVPGVMFLMTNTLVAQQLPTAGQIDTAGAGDILYDYFIGSFEKTVDGISKIPDAFNRGINNSLGMDQFHSSVEKNSENTHLGVFLNNVRPSQKEYLPGYPVIIWGMLEGETFVGNINARHSCYATRRDVSYPGSVYPKESTFIGRGSEALECELDNLDSGLYTVHMLSTFKFETWGDINYVYTDINTARSYYKSGENINSALDINRKATGIQTDGPVDLGLSPHDLPIQIDFSRERPIELSRFGISLSSKWPQGKIGYIETASIVVPQGIKFSSCIPKWTKYDQSTNTYSFEVDTQKLVYSSSISCKPVLTDPDNFIGLNFKTSKTFGAKVLYSYTLEKTTSVKVKGVSS